ncbi:MAG TPA: hypothetical protein VNT03_16270 [Baekduia sp.]|nr:hypothetical protein [Baekduia sp.]
MTSPTRDAVVTVGAGPDALAQALATPAEWLWFVAERARPREDALDLLLAAVEPEDAAPATVLAGLLVDERGAPLERDLQATPRLDAEAAVHLVRQCLLPIRSAGFAHCLVARVEFDRHGLPDHRRFGPFAGEEWTGRVLRESVGYLVAASAVELPAQAERPDRGPSLLHLRAAMHMLPTGTWSRGDAVRALRRAVTGLLPS